MKTVKTNKLAVWFLTACLVFTSAPPALAGSAPAKNVIVLMTDGTGSTHTALSRWYQGSAFPSDSIIVGGVRTYGADSIITDSAPAATAFATGHKTDDKFVGILPARVTIPGVPAIAEELKYKPVASVLEGARLNGKATGLVATCNIQHASPAGFSAHWPDRSNFNEIAEQQANENIDVVLSGGKQYLLPTELGGTRIDGENLIARLQARGYGIVENKDDMMKYSGSRLWGLFASDAMAYDMDRALLRPTEPSLAEMTQKAIDVLANNPKGFFLFVEGSKVDWASHANDPIGVISDTLAFQKAVGKALDFAEKDGNTLVLVFADHSNGGMSIGVKADPNYPGTQLDTLLKPLKAAKLTGEGIEQMLKGDLSEENIRLVMANYYGVNDLTAQEITDLQKAKKGAMNYATGPIISKRSIIGWTTNGHTGEDVFLYAYGPNKPAGLIENNQLAYIAAKSMGFDLDQADSKLFVEAGAAFQAIGASVRLDKSDENNFVLVVEKAGKKAELPISQNIIKIGTRSQEMNGITVYAPKTGKVYVPAQAVELVKSAGM